MPETTQFGGKDKGGAENAARSGFTGNAALKPGDELLERYKIEGQLGGGGQGAVYQARDMNFPQARRLVAIKEMHVNASDPTLQQDAMKTFKREANILATLTHPAIPKIYDFFPRGERAYLVMEYINGRDLEAILVKTKNKGLPLSRIVDWAIDLCDVLHYLHSHQPEPIIFRDMKPANLMVDSLGKIRLIDFGIAKVFVKDLPQTMIGTEGYSAPEQYKGKANPTSDIYSLGATLHHVITRRDPRLELPFSFKERPLSQYNPEATKPLEDILNKALEFEPENRYQTCADMKADLEAYKFGSASSNAITSGAGNAAKVANRNGSEGDNTDPEADGTDFFAGEDIEIGGGMEAAWTFKTEDEIRGNPTAYQNMVFVGSYDTNVWAVSVESGELIWKYSTDGGIASSPVVDTEYKQILFGSEDYTYAAVDMRDGRLNWTYTTGDKIRGTGRIAHGHVFFGSDDAKLYALIANNGRYMWEYQADGPVRSTPFVTNDRVIFGTESGEVIALELNGQRKWGYRTRRGVTSSPVVDDDDICYVGSFDGYLYAIDAVNGYSQWRYRTMGPIVSSPAYADRHVYVGSADGKMYCINTETGRDRWSFDTGAPIVSSPRVHQNVVYFGGTDNKLYAVDATKGTEIWQFEAGGQITGSPIITPDFVIFGSLDRTLYALPLISQ